MNNRNDAYDINIYGPSGTHCQKIRMLGVPDKVVTKLQLHAKSS